MKNNTFKYSISNLAFFDINSIYEGKYFNTMVYEMEIEIENITDDNVINREFNAYNNIADNYPKYVISMDKFDMSQNGIIHKNIIDWLIDK